MHLYNKLVCYKHDAYFERETAELAGGKSAGPVSLQAKGPELKADATKLFCQTTYI